MKNPIFTIFLVSLMLTLQINSYSQWSNNPNDPLAICQETRVQTNPTISEDGSGGHFVFWADGRDYSSGQVADLYGQRLNSNGIEQWTSAGKIITDSITNYNEPQVYYTGNGNAIILYKSTNSGNRIWARKINTAGNDVWNNPVAVFVQNTLQLNGEKFLAVTDGNNGLIISYQLTYTGGATFVYAQRIDGNGNLKWTSNGLNLSVNGQSRSPEISSDGRGGANIFWYKVPGPYLIYKTHIDSSGNFLAKDTLNNTGNNFPQIRTVEDGSGGTVVTWANNSGSLTGNVYAQRVDINGNILWDINGVAVCDSPGGQYDPNIEITSDGNFIIVWKDERVSGINNAQVYSQKYNPAGIPQWTPNGILISDLSTTYPHPDVISDNSGGAFIFMYNLVSDFCATRVNGDSTFAWDPPIRSLASLNYRPFYEKFKLAHHTNGAVVVWQTFVATLPISYGIYGALVRNNGTLNIQQISNEIPDGFELKQNYPNPFNPVTSIEFNIPNSEFISLKVYNALGKEVTVLVSEKKPAGRYSITFEGSNISSGVYFYKLEAGNFVETKHMILLK